MFYPKDEYKKLKKATGKSVVIIGTCQGHKDITEKEPVSIIVAPEGIFIERAKGEDAVVKMEDILGYQQKSGVIMLKTKDKEAKRLVLHIRMEKQKESAAKIIGENITKVEE